MSKRIPKSKERRKRLKEILLGQGREGLSELFGNLLLHAAGIMVQELLEAECEEFLERPYYGRKGQGRKSKGYRNGYRPLNIKTAEGLLTCSLPKVRDTEMPFRSKIAAFFKGNTEVLEKLACEMYARGLSTRDIEDALVECTGDAI